MTFVVEGNLDDFVPSLFDSLAIEDENVIEIEYLGNLGPLERVVGHSNAKNSTTSNLSISIAMIVALTLVIAGATGTSLVLVLGKPGGPIAKEIEADDNYSAVQRSDMTIVTPSDELSGSDPLERWPNPFVVAEQEGSTWRSWGIPLFKGHLGSIREEVSSDDEYFDEKSI